MLLELILNMLNDKPGLELSFRNQNDNLVVTLREIVGSEMKTIVRHFDEKSLQGNENKLVMHLEAMEKELET